MKALKILSYMTVAYIACGIGYHLGKYEANKQRSKDYQVASIMTTCCNNMVDNIGLEAEEIYYEYLDNLDCYNLSITKEDITKYNSWY